MSWRGVEPVTSDFKPLSEFSPCRRTARKQHADDNSGTFLCIAFYRIFLWCFLSRDGDAVFARIITTTASALRTGREISLGLEEERESRRYDRLPVGYNVFHRESTEGNVIWSHCVTFTIIFHSPEKFLYTISKKRCFFSFFQTKIHFLFNFKKFCEHFIFPHEKNFLFNF